MTAQGSDEKYLELFFETLGNSRKKGSEGDPASAPKDDEILETHRVEDVVVDSSPARQTGGSEQIVERSDVAEGSEYSQLEDDTRHYLAGFELYVLLTGLTMGAFLLMIDTTILVTAIPTLTTYFKSVDDVGWYGSSYLIATSVLQLFFGKLYDLYNSKFIFLGAFAVFEAGALICGLANSSVIFILGRAVSGAGGAGLLNGAFTIIAASVPLEKRPLYIGIIFSVACAGMAVGPLIGGVITEQVTWRWCFYLNLPAGVVTAVTLMYSRIANVRLQRNERISVTEQLRRLDVPGCILFAAATLMFLMALEWGGVTYTWHSPLIVSLFWASGLSVVLFLGWEYRQGESAMLPPRLVCRRIVAFSAAANFMSYGGLYIIVTYIPIWFQAVKGDSPLMSGVHYLPNVAALTITAALSGYLVSRIGYYTPFVLIGSLFATAGCVLMTRFTPNSSISAWVWYQILNGIGRGMLSQQAITAVQANLPSEEFSMANALMIFYQNFGGAVFVSLGQTSFDNELRHSLAKYVPQLPADVVAMAGATGFRKVAPAAAVLGIVEAYNKAITTTFYITVAASIAVFVLGWGMGWTNIRKRRDREPTTYALDTDASY